MISDESRRILAAACGVKWHEIETYFDASGFCEFFSLCACGDKWRNDSSIDAKHRNLTFTTSDDWELVRTTVVVPHLDPFYKFAWQMWVDSLPVVGSMELTFRKWWLTKPPEEKNEITAQFVKENVNLFPDVQEKIREIIGKEKV